jgi:hypothetical protein
MRWLAFSLLLIPSLAVAQVPLKLNYQGRLMDAAGTPQVGVAQVTFAIFKDATAGTALWSETQGLALTSGYYATVLGDVNAIPATVFDGTERFLELSLASTPLVPRARMDSVPYAIAAGTSQYASGSSVFRITTNQVLAGTETGGVDTVNSWSVNPACGVTFKFMFKVDTNVVWTARTAEEQALLTAMGREGTQYIERAFNVYRMSWSSVCPWTMFQHVPMQPMLTTAAFTKLESGVIEGQWATGIKSTWGLSGTHILPGIGGYAHPHPNTTTATGSILIAMPATVVGYVDLNRPINWGWFTYMSADTSL